MECLNASRVWDMGPNTQVDEWTTTIDCSACSIWDFGSNKGLFVLIVLKHLYKILLSNNKTLKWLLLLNGFLCNGLKRLVVGLGNNTNGC